MCLLVVLGILIPSLAYAFVYEQQSQTTTQTIMKTQYSSNAEQQDASVGGGVISSGTYADTQTSNDVREVLTETAVAGKYKLGWIYTFSSLPFSRIDTRFYIEANIGASEKTDAFIAYRDSTTSLNTPKERTWTGDTASWGSQSEMATADSPVRFIRVAVSPIAERSYEKIVVTLSDDGYFDAYVWDGTAWSVTNNIASTNPLYSVKDYRCFDIVYEKTTGRALLVYSRGETTNEIGYKIWTYGTGWSSEYLLNLGYTSARVYWIALASAPGTRSGTTDDNEIAMIYFDGNNNVHGYVWTGLTWSLMGATAVWDSAAWIYNYETIAVAYEQTSGRAMFVWSDMTASYLCYRIWDGSTLSGPTDLYLTGSDDPGDWITLKANPINNELLLVVITSPESMELFTAYWSGSSWTVHAKHDDTMAWQPSRVADFAWEPTGSRGLLVWGSTYGKITYRVYTAPNTWETKTEVTMGTNYQRWVQLKTNPRSISGDVKILGVVLDSLYDIGAIKWDGTTFTVIGSNTISSDTASVVYECFDLEFMNFPEPIKIQWSTSTDGSWTNLVTMTSSIESTYGPYDIPNDTATTLYIRVRDTADDTSASTIPIDHMYFLCQR